MRQEVLDGIEYARSSEGRAAVELRRIKLLDNGCAAALLPPRSPQRAHHIVASHSPACTPCRCITLTIGRRPKGGYAQIRLGFIPSHRPRGLALATFL